VTGVSDTERSGINDKSDAARVGQPEHWGWTRELTPPEANVVVPVTRELLRQGRAWVNRRVHTVTLVDEYIARQQVSVDFRLPERLPGGLQLGGATVFLIPLTFLPRRSDLAFFDLRDETDTRVSLVTREENALLTGLVLIAAAGGAMEGYNRRNGTALALDQNLLTFLAAVPTSRDTAPFIRRILNPSDVFLYPDPRVNTGLLESDEFRDLLGICSFCSVIHVPLVARPGERRIIKIGWEERWGRRRVAETPPHTGRRERWWAGTKRRWGQFSTWVGWRADIRWLATPQVGPAESHHVQIAVPEDVELTEAGMRNGRAYSFIERYAPRGPDDFNVALGRGAATVEPDNYQPFEPGIKQRTQLYVPSAHTHRAGIMWVGLRAARHGFLRGAFTTSAAVACLLTVYALRADSIMGSSEMAAAVMLLVPALVAGFLVRPGEHAMARHLLRGPRILTATVAGLPLVAAAGLVAIPEGDKSSARSLEQLLGSHGYSEAPDSLVSLWGTLAVAALVLTLALGRSALLPRAGQQESKHAPTSSAALLAGSERTDRADRA
jgi:hypothetical protein